MNEQLEIPLEGQIGKVIVGTPITIEPTYDPNAIIFSFTDPPEEIMRLNKEGFFWKGKLIQDDKEIYEKFKSWVNKAHELDTPKPKSNSIEGYQNTIELLKRTLQFYALKENYDVSHPINNQLFSFVEMDGGSQARFSLDKIREIDELNEKLEKDYNAEIDALQNITDDEILNNFLNDNNIQ
jgi:hypothetical protein